MSKPKIFIGSSVEGLNVAYAIQENLKFHAETTIWNQGVFNLSESTLESLINVLESSDFGIFVFSPDDYIKIRGKKDLAVRDNVLFELGLFIGKLGRSRSFIIVPDNKEFHLPTDLIGLTPGKYEANRNDKNFVAGTGNFCFKVTEAINKNGFFNNPIEEPNDNEKEEDNKKIPTEKNHEDWVLETFINKDYNKAIKILDKQIKNEKDNITKIALKCNKFLVLSKQDALASYSEFEKLISENININIPYIEYSNVLYWNNDYKKSLEIIERGLVNCERKIYLTKLKAKIFWTLNRKEEAIKILEDVVDNCETEDIFLDLSKYYYENNENNKSFEVLKKGYFSFPQNENIISGLAKLCFDLQYYEISIFLYKELIHLNPKHISYHVLFANSLLQFDELYNLALQSYEKAESFKKNEAWIYSNIGNLYNNKGLYNKAEENIKKSLELDENSEYSHNRLSQVLISKEKELQKLKEIINKGKEKLNSDSI